MLPVLAVLVLPVLAWVLPGLALVLPGLAVLVLPTVLPVFAAVPLFAAAFLLPVSHPCCCWYGQLRWCCQCCCRCWCHHWQLALPVALLLFGRAVAIWLLGQLALAMALAVQDQVCLKAERQVEVLVVLLHWQVHFQEVELEVHLPQVLLPSVQPPPTVTGGEAVNSVPQAAECPPKLELPQVANRSCPKSNAVPASSAPCATALLSTTTCRQI